MLRSTRSCCCVSISGSAFQRLAYSYSRAPGCANLGGCSRCLCNRWFFITSFSASPSSPSHWSMGSTVTGQERWLARRRPHGICPELSEPLASLRIQRCLFLRAFSVVHGTAAAWPSTTGFLQQLVGHTPGRLRTVRVALRQANAHAAAFHGVARVQVHFGSLLGSCSLSEEAKALILVNEDVACLPIFLSFLIPFSVRSGERLLTKSHLCWVKVFSPCFLKFFRSIVEASF